MPVKVPVATREEGDVLVVAAVELGMIVDGMLGVANSSDSEFE